MMTSDYTWLVLSTGYDPAPALLLATVLTGLVMNHPVASLTIEIYT